MTLSLYPDPTRERVAELGAAWDLHPVLLEDLHTGHQRPKLERHGQDLFLVVRSARYLDATEEIALEEFHLLLRPGAVAVLCQDGRWIDGTDAHAMDPEGSDPASRRIAALLADDDLLRLGPRAVAYRFLDAVVDAYLPVLRGLVVDKEQIERQVFTGDPAATERIYRLSQEVVELQQASTGLADVLEAFRDVSRQAVDGAAADGEDPLAAYLEDVADHLARVNDQVADLREALTQILTVNATIVAQRQNEDMKKISGWAAILFAPTLVAAIYGMNFDRMPELAWPWGYPFAMVGMVAFSVILYVVFRRRRWM
ncbi:magnesium and cobalt transport protein CorA [Serinibacter salmoneus]|nr:magnesium and cobalt transport protein CorA [Serinibacter salmoneus]